MRTTTMKESLDRSELRRMQREQERERRRIRDRQRRQSMTVEQRERHLARRRRNYQLRRLRAENAKVDFQSNQISNEQHEAVSDVQEVTQGENLSIQSLQYSECLDGVACKGSNLNVQRLRLSHVRRLARSGSRLGCEVIADHQIGGEVVVKGDANNTSCFQIGDFDSGRLPNGLRLNRVKRLARAINTASNEASVNGQVIGKNTMDQNHSQGESQGIGNDSSNLDKLSLAEVKLKDLTWTDKHPAWANVES
ncbi:hypothetical protein RchiOBHm_Chr5g0000901 [Rosa chinensis]|uniref:Uncharacterized protein n=1 Tax=Rosa chinensis TaxID=74649 RepID=A0A2P6Q240_ROSCH|nr:uncharacterized protein LOC112201565 [Rosa chinensis]PRQ28241.1 hypothetical protein RchiOBHm_Chr5g0000901 [Rosa chinensis]